jgi:hypothetical protein
MKTPSESKLATAPPKFTSKASQIRQTQHHLHESLIGEYREYGRGRASIAMLANKADASLKQSRFGRIARSSTNSPGAVPARPRYRDLNLAIGIGILRSGGPIKHSIDVFIR